MKASKMWCINTYMVRDIQLHEYYGKYCMEHPNIKVPLSSAAIFYGNGWFLHNWCVTELIKIGWYSSSFHIDEIETDYKNESKIT